MAGNEIEEVKQKTDIIELISSYLSLKKAGRNHRALCPFHHEKTPSFMVSPELQIFKCFGCSRGGDCFAFIQEMEGLDFAGSLHFLADRAGVKLTSTRSSPQAQKKEQFYKVNDLAAEYFHFLLTEHKVGREVLVYLKGRDLGEAAVKKFQLGYAPRSWDSLTKFLLKKKFSLGDILSSGLALPQEGGRGYYDRFRGRLMFPLKDVGGRVVGFSGRVFHEKEEPKYLNSPETEIFKKSEMLYGLDLAKSFIKKENLAVVVEGQTDMITPFMAGTKNIVASLGTALTLGQIGLLQRFTENVSLCFDADIAGDAATRRGIELAEEAGLSVKIVTLPGGIKDPDECVRKDGAGWREALSKAENVYDFLFSAAQRQFDVKDPLGKKKISQRLLPIISGISNEILKMHYLRQLAALLGVGEETVVRELNRLGRLGAIISPVKRERETTVTTANPPSRQEILQESFLALLLASPLTLAQNFLGKVGQKDFLGQSYRGLFAEIKSYYRRRERTVKIKTFYDKIPIPLRPAFEHLYLKAEQSYTFLPEQELTALLGSTIKEMKREALKQRLQELGAAIKDLEKTGEGGELKRAQKEFKELSVKLREE